MIIRKTTDDTAASSNAMLGLSGLDSASMLKAMMKPYKAPISSLTQKQQAVVWKQERYRDLISKLSGLKAKYFDNSNAATNIRSAGVWNKFLVENPGGEYVKITTTNRSTPKNGTVELIEMPTATAISGRSGLVKDVVGYSAPNWAEAAGSYFTINMDGITRSILITPAMAALPTDAEKVAALQGAVSSAFGPGMITVGQEVGGRLKLTANPAQVNQFKIIDGGIATARLALGFNGPSNLSNKVVLTDTLGYLGDRMNVPIDFKTATVYENGLPVTRRVVEFTLNRTSFQFTEFNLLKSVIDTVNGSNCGARLAYDSVADRFTVSATVCGPGDTVTIKESETNFLAAIGIGFVDEDGLLPGVNVVGGGINPSMVALVNTANSGFTPTPYIFNVTVNGIEKQVRLTRDDYADEEDMIADVNAQLQLLFPDAGLAIGVQPPVIPTDPWKITLNIDKTKPNAAYAVRIGVDPATPPGAMGDFGLTALDAKLAAISPVHTSGVFGKAVIDGAVVQLDSAVLEYEGAVYEFKRLPPLGHGPISYSIRTDTDKIVELIRGFVDAYNEVVRAIGAALNEKRDKDYKPLTDEEKGQFSEKEIEKWEAKAKAGILRGDVHFSSLSSKLRLSVFNPIYDKYGKDDVSAYDFNLKSMGIDTKDGMSMFNPLDNGALYVDEEALRYSIEANLGKIVKLFTKPPEVFVPREEDLGKPDAWKAQMQRLYDDKSGGLTTKLLGVLDDYIRTTRGANNAKGILIERAGIENDMSELKNALTDEINGYSRRINSLWDRYDRIEKQKIKTLSRLETIINNAAAQMQWMQNQTGQK